MAAKMATMPASQFLGTQVATPSARSASARNSASRRAPTVAMATKKTGTKVLVYNEGRFQENFKTGKANESGGILSKIESLRLLSRVEKLGLLSKLEKSGLTLSKIEELGLLSKAEKLGALSLLEKVATVNPAAIASASLPFFLFAAAAFVALNGGGEDPAAVATQLVVSGGLGTVGLGLFVSSYLVAALQEE